MAKLAALLLSTAALWVQTSLKNTKMGDISTGVTNTLSSPAKIYILDSFVVYERLKSYIIEREVYTVDVRRKI